MIARITGITTLSPTIKRITLQAADGAPLPAASAGSHIILTIPGPSRSWKNAYSLVSPSGNHQEYQIIVRRVEHSRGGSAWLHDHAAIGAKLEISHPANLFPISRTAPRHLLISAGIGITPFLAYLPTLQANAAKFELHHCCKLADAAAFDMLLPKNDNIVLHTSRNSLNFTALLSRQKLGTHLYICGPAEFMDAVLAAARNLGWPEAKLHQERFGGATGGAPFTVKLARTGLTLAVAADENLLEVLEAAGLNPACLCRGGACGECAVPVLSGVPDHHDHVLNEAERAAGNIIMACVSRAKTPELVLDL
jgi:ferredoxin-NADP reductase